MEIVLLFAGLLILSGLISLCLNRFAHLSNGTGALGAATACFLGLGALFVILRNPVTLQLFFPWQVPFGSISLALDPLAALFLFPILLLSGLAALFGYEYLKHYYGKKNIGASWFFFNLLVASMAFVVTARNAIFFILAWEMMSVSSFFLVLFEGEKKEVAKSGLTYLIATHIGTFFLFVMFILLAKESGSFDFSKWTMPPLGFMPSIIFLCAIIGFGTKAGFMPMHIWLPEAHPAAPSHVSAVMSGVMIKTGIYGLVRVIGFLGPPCGWWGQLLIAIGVVSGILGVLFALAQHDLKRLLAYHSIENIGIISMGIGLGLWGMTVNNPILTVIGFSGGLMHVVNHAFFKGLLFLGAGAVYHETGTREIDALGGLLKKMPVTGLCFFIGAAAICGLPPLNGFISEFFIYFASLEGLRAVAPTSIISLGIITSLALIGGLALACFTKAFGIIFLGEARSAHGREAHDPGVLMKIPLIILAAACVFMGLISPFLLNIFNRIVLDLTGVLPGEIEGAMVEVMSPLTKIVAVALLLYTVILIIVLIRRILLKGRRIEQAPTWDCGYARPHPRMQYTASSFAQPLVDFFKGILRTHKHASTINSYFPDNTSFKTETSDLFSEKVFGPAFKSIHRFAEKLTWIQHGRLQFYVLYILFTLVALLIWKL